MNFPYNTQWERVQPSSSTHVESHDSFELIRLHLWLAPRTNEAGYQEADLIFEKDRRTKPTQEPRKLVENFLASAALTELVGSNVDWRSLSVKEIREHTQQREDIFVQLGN